MILDDFFIKHNVLYHSFSDAWKFKPTDTVVGIENVLGKDVWICDYHNGKNPLAKPVRNLKPTFVRIFHVKDSCKKTCGGFYGSPIFFRKLKNGIPIGSEIGVFDNTTSLNSLHIFENEDECKKQYVLLLDIAMSEIKSEISIGEDKISELSKLKHAIFIS